MSRRVVCDASALVAVLVDGGPGGRWAAQELSGVDLAAPSLLAFESANIVRRHEIAGLISSDQAAQAHADLLDLAIEYWPYDVLAGRAWELRRNLSSYDASYVALAELTGATLVTLDHRIAGAPGLRAAIAAILASNASSFAFAIAPGLSAEPMAAFSPQRLELRGASPVSFPLHRPCGWARIGRWLRRGVIRG